MMCIGVHCKNYAEGFRAFRCKVGDRLIDKDESYECHCPEKVERAILVSSILHPKYYKSYNEVVAGMRPEFFRMLKTMQQKMVLKKIVDTVKEHYENKSKQQEV